MIRTLTLLLHCLAVTFSIKQRRILHGDAVDQETLELLLPFVVFVSVNCDSNLDCQACTGSLIEPRKVLLAAHCFCRPDGTTYVFFNATVAGQGKRIKATLGKRKNFNCNYYARHIYQADIDVATLILDEPMDEITPVNLNCDNHDSEKRVTMVGFGLDETVEEMELSMAVEQLKACHESITDAFCIEAGEDEPQVGRGDSGGPLLVYIAHKYEQIGIASGQLNVSVPFCNDDGETEYKYNQFSVYTKVSAHCDFIKND